jgi:glucose 1-dehydrogenase
MMIPVYEEFRGKRALITGGTQGIGKAIAARLARNGATVFLNYAGSHGPAQETLAEFQAAGYEAALCQADIGVPEAVDAMMDKIHESGPLDYLVCNASYQQKNKGFFDTDYAVLKRTLDVNIFGNFQIMRSVADRMVAAGRKGTMLLCSSGHGTFVFEGTFAYDVSKAGLNHFMRCAALDLIAKGIRLNAVDIGWTHTPGERRWFTRDQQDELARSIPIGRAAEADEIAAVSEFLLCEQSNYVVGALYCVDGGFALKPNGET